MNTNSSSDQSCKRISEKELLSKLNLACDGIPASIDDDDVNIRQFAALIHQILLHEVISTKVKDYYSFLAENAVGFNHLLNLKSQSNEERALRLNSCILSQLAQCQLANALAQLLTQANIDNFYTQQAFVRRSENRIILLNRISQIETKCSRRTIDSSCVTQSNSSSLNSAERAVKVSGDRSFRCRTKIMPNICDREVTNSSFSTNEGSSLESTRNPIEALDASSYTYSSPSSTGYQVPIQLINVDDIEIHTDCHSANSQLQEKSKPLNISKSISSLKLDIISNRTSIASMSTSPTELLFNVAAVDGGKLKSHYSSPVIQTFSNEKMKKSRKSSRHNLAIFLESLNISSRTKVDLDREARHFHLSEAIIATSQHMKMNRLLSQKYNMPESRKGRETIQPEKKLNSTTPSKSPVKSSQPSKFIVGSTEDESSDSSENLSVNSAPPNDNSVPDTAPHLEWTGDPHSAESIALMLMTKFKSQPLPNPNELYWLVNESQAPQQILPFGDLSVPVNPDDDVPYHSIRGNDTWAPPRNMLIFHVQPPPERRRLLMQQNHRCAGCGQKVAPSLARTFRYCHYLGKYFCSACHKNQIALIPARVISNWDFTLYHVSNFSLKWLDEIANLPLFHIADLKPQLYERVKQLSKARRFKVKLQAICEFIAQCRFAESEKRIVKALPEHWLEDVDVWSMNDFVDVQNGTFVKKILDTIRTLEAHVLTANCELCKARGWRCEGCPNKDDVIFPWQEKISRCCRCGSCYHEKCLKECAKCERLKKRGFVVKKPRS